MAARGLSRSGRLPDYYDVLGVAPSASFREIEAAYWARANRADLRAQLPLINEAYEVLGHGQRREAYDAEYVPQQSESEQTSPAEPQRSNPGLADKLNWYLR